MDHRDFRQPLHRHPGPDIPWRDDRRDDRDDRDAHFNPHHNMRPVWVPQHAPTHWNHKDRGRRGDRSPSSDAASTIGGHTDTTTATTRSTRTMNPLAMAKRGEEVRRRRNRENERPQPHMLQPISPSPVAATITTTTTTKTTTKKQIYLPNPGVDIALRNLRREVDSSLKTYNSLLRNFLVETSMLRESRAVDHTTLDRIWWDKITAKIRDSRNPEGKRKKIEYAGLRLSECRRLIREAVERAGSSIEVLLAQTATQHHAPSSPSTNGKAVDFEKLRFPRSDSEDESDSDTRSRGGGGSGGGTSVVVNNNIEGILERVRLLERQIRVGKKAIEYCDGIASYHPERAMVEYLAGWDLVNGLKKLDEQFRDWKKKYDWILLRSDCRTV
ncbi:hypothetical protein V8F20_001992 [Naviculisporaceae sp. PSN 640]